ncbi:CU044_2847 family protein [Streptomyces phaeofaciens]|uniref:CU044_2847 family protein n=1 Tax=Streptomyces phaeofaciens TaxID=68254 RepID=UPI0036A42E7C
MEFVEVHTAGPRPLLVQVDGADAVVEAGRAADLLARGTESFESAMDAVRDAARTAVTRVRELSQPPQEVTVQFAVQLAAEAGVVVAKTAATANMSISLTWRSSDPHE